MIKYLVLGTVFLCLFNITAHAGPVKEKAKPNKDVIGLGLGAVIGGLVAGPPGAILGAAGGAWYEDRQVKKETRLTALKQRLLKKQSELTSLQGEFAAMENKQKGELQKVKMERQVSALDKLSQGVTLTVYFRTNSSSIDPENTDRIEHLAQYLQTFPEIQINLDGYSDRRGTDKYNLQLSRQRADAVRQALMQGGLQATRIHTHAYGKSMAKAAAGDREGYVFDRRVIIQLSLDNEVYAVK